MTVCPISSNVNLLVRNLDPVTRDIGFFEDCLVNIFPFNGIVDELEFNMAVKGIQYLPNFDYLRIQTDILNIKTRSHTMDQHTDVDDCYYHRLSNLKTQYLDTYQLTDILNHHNTDFSLLNINSRSLKRNGNRANLEMDQLRWSFSIIAVTETWTSEEDQSTVFFPGYKTCLKSRKNEAYGGVGLFLNEMLISNFEIVSYPVDELIMETLFVNITYLSTSHWVIGL